jgi:hypothetical protein
MKKKVITLLTMVLVITILAGCSMQRESLIEKIDKEETYPEAPGQLETVYSDMNAIATDADLIVQISVVDQTVEILDGFPQTHTDVKVTAVYKGMANVGDELEVVEEGGQDGKVMGGLPQLNNANDYILFLTEYNGSYYVCGAFQGRFIEREGYVFQQATEDTKLRGYTPISVEDFADSLTGLTVENDKTE